MEITLVSVWQVVYLKCLGLERNGIPTFHFSGFVLQSLWLLASAVQTYATERLLHCRYGQKSSQKSLFWWYFHISIVINWSM